MQFVGMILFFVCLLHVHITINGQCTGNKCTVHCKNRDINACVCDTGWSGSTALFCQRENIAFGRTARGHSSAPLAVDGNLSTFSQTDVKNYPSWHVIFDKEVMVKKAQIVLSAGWRDDFEIHVTKNSLSTNSFTLCKKDKFYQSYNTYSWNIECDSARFGNVFIVKKIEKTSYLTLYEVSVFLCQSGTYGDECQHRCNVNCQGHCYPDTGACLSCITGKYGQYCDIDCAANCLYSTCRQDTGTCDACKLGYYGVNCMKNCSLGCYGNECSQQTGYCSQSCLNGYVGNKCTPCSVGKYGSYCLETCSDRCINNQCNNVDGSCSCRIGYSGRYCYPCRKGQYGSNCSKTCDYCRSHDCNNMGECNVCSIGKYSLNCSLDCPNVCGGDGSCTITEGLCLSCKNGSYGRNCEKKCSRYCLNPLSCDKNDGYCADGCKQGWVGRTCDQECKFLNCAECKIRYFSTVYCSICNIGWYLQNECKACPENCTSCKAENECTTCNTGFTGITCSERCSSFCRNGTCDINGQCSEGCNPGYYGSKCDKRCSSNCTGGYTECSDKTGECNQGCGNKAYGTLCNTPCRKKCISCKGERCDVCENGYYGDWCSSCRESCLTCKSYSECTMCKDGFYGKLCENPCPPQCISCYNESSCFECKPGWSGVTCSCNANCLEGCGVDGQCMGGCRDGLYGLQCSLPCTVNECARCDQSTGNCSQCASGKYGKDCMKLCSPNCAGSQCDIAGSCFRGCINGFTGNTCFESQRPPYSLIAGLLAAVLVLVLVVVIFLCRRRLQKAEVKENTDELSLENRAVPLPVDMAYENCESFHNPDPPERTPKIQTCNEKSVYAMRGSCALLDEIDQNSNEELEHENTVIQSEYYNVQMKRIPVQQLLDTVQEKKAKRMYCQEFENLPQGLVEHCSAAVKSDNRSRNRYKKIYPYDFNRVVLNTLDGYGDYINASYINGMNKEKTYIASQGPFTSDTVIDFWRMIWQEKCHKIVMLTNLKEGGTMKCLQYWPNETETYGSVEVKLLQVSSFANFIVRTLEIKQITTDEKRLVTHYHFTAWPDKDVPRIASTIVEFRNKVVNTTDLQDTPVIVHCSAGIGRTGTYIALDYLMIEGQQHGYIDVVHCLSTLRGQRTGLVQTLEQYEFLHDAVLEGLTGTKNAVDTKEFHDYYDRLKSVNPKTEKTYLFEQFEMMTNLVPQSDGHNFSTAKLPENRHKNRYTNILAAESFRFFVNTPGGSDYINAIMLPGFKKAAGFALTQMPLKETVEDFWDLITSQNITTIVMMNSPKKDKGLEKYWPEQGSLDIGNINVELIDTTHLDNVNSLKFRVNTKGDSNEPMMVKQFQCLFWPEDAVVPHAPGPMIELLDLVNTWKMQSQSTIIAVHCMNGAKKSGLFCTIANIVERLRTEQVVDVFQTVLQMRSRRQQIVSSKEQLKYCYDVVEAYLDMYETYSNFT